MHQKHLIMTYNVHSEMLGHLKKCLPEEGCGLVCGDGKIISKIMIVENILHSPTRFICDPEGLIRSFEIIERNNLELMGIFHSHLNGLETPSCLDVKDHLYPVTMIIWTSKRNEWIMKCFHVSTEKYKEIEWSLIYEN